nr:VWA domain-containing protein [Acidimicrobiia bacterium]
MPNIAGTGRKRARRTGALVLLAVTAGTALTPATALAQAEELRVRDVDRSAFPEVTAVVGVPRDLSSSFLPASAFSIRQGDEVLTPEVTRLRDDRLAVALVVDPATSIDGLSFLAAKQAMSELVVGLPSGAAIAIIGAGPEPGIVTPGTEDRSLVLASLEALQQRSRPSSMADALDLIPEALPTEEGERREAVVLATSPAGAGSDLDPDSVADRLEASDTAVHAVLLNVGGAGRLGAVADATGGTTTAAGALNQLPAAFLAVGEQLEGQYRLRFRAPEAGPVDLAVSGPGASAATTIQVGPELTAGTPEETGQTAPTDVEATPAPASEDTTSSEGNGGGGVGLLVVILFVLAVIIWAGVFLLRRRGRAGAEHSDPAATAVASVETPMPEAAPAPDEAPTEVLEEPAPEPVGEEPAPEPVAAEPAPEPVLDEPAPEPLAVVEVPAEPDAEPTDGQRRADEARAQADLAHQRRTTLEAAQREADQVRADASAAADELRRQAEQ